MVTKTRTLGSDSWRVENSWDGGEFDTGNSSCIEKRHERSGISVFFPNVYMS